MNDDQRTEILSDIVINLSISGGCSISIGLSSGLGICCGGEVGMVQQLIIDRTAWGMGPSMVVKYIRFFFLFIHEHAVSCFVESGPQSLQMSFRQLLLDGILIRYQSGYSSL